MENSSETNIATEDIILMIGNMDLERWRLRMVTFIVAILWMIINVKNIKINNCQMKRALFNQLNWQRHLKKREWLKTVLVRLNLENCILLLYLPIIKLFN